MCEWCAKHGAGKKWYENVRNYSDEMAEETKAFEFNDKWLILDSLGAAKEIRVMGHKIKSPLVGRYAFERLKKTIETPKPDFGQVVPLKDAREILKLANPIIRFACTCLKQNKGKTEYRCLAFGVCGDAFSRFPDFVPRGAEKLSTEEATAYVEDFQSKGYVTSVWCHPVPYVGAMCICDTKYCNGCIYRKVYGLKTFYIKSHYVAVVDLDKCTGCKDCVARCQFNAITYSPSYGRVFIDIGKCFGCGLCESSCPENAIKLSPRSDFPSLKNEW